MTCFLNMKNNIGTVCPHNVFWTKAIQDENKLLKRTNCLSQLHYHRLKQGYQWGERAQPLKPGSRLHTGQHQVCKTASTWGEREEVHISFYLEAWPRPSSSMVLFGFPVNWFHNGSCLLPPACCLVKQFGCCRSWKCSWVVLKAPAFHLCGSWAHFLSRISKLLGGPWKRFCEDCGVWMQRHLLNNAS